MERVFCTHEVRKSRECGPVWTFTALDAGGLEKPEKLIVPGVWEAHPRLRNYRGRGVYEQKIHCGGNVRIWLGGVSFRAAVYLDDALLAEHYGAYTGFEGLAQDVPEGEHTLRVEADNRFGEDSALHIPNDYYAYGGINRPVLVEELGKAYITRCRVTPRKTEQGWVAEAEVSVRNLGGETVRGTVKVTLAGQTAAVQAEVPANRTAAVKARVACGNAEEWTPDTPVLYMVKAVLEMDGAPADDWIDRIGFREVRTEGNRILLNGKPLRLKGFNRHEEYGAFGLSAPLAGMMQDLQLMREMGANCVRTCHYPNDPRFLDLCDETGMLVWEESHARGLDEERMRHPRFMDQLRLSTEEMVEQHFNHPSIFIWGCLNECADDTEYGAECYREILNLLKRLDGSRPVTAALLERPGGKVYGEMDAVSVNLYPQWYHDTPVEKSLGRKMTEIREKGGAGKPVIVSEIGAGAIYGFHDPLGEAKWSEERQCRILKDQIQGVLANSEVTGVFLWQFADVRVDGEWFARRPKTVNNKGVVDEYRRPKLAFRTVKDCFQSGQES
ncbi:MAG: hypothetical protein II888_01260 [Clostridia bacterium]|nr:hypothetical protein [Clostridia bacterium]